MTYDPFDPFNQLLTETPAYLLASGGFWVKQQFYEEPPVYTDYFLKFADQAEADGILFDVQADAEGNEVKTPRYAAIDIIGTIYKGTGKFTTTPEGKVEKVAAQAGWHVNVRHTDEAPELDAYKVVPDPVTPARMWA